MTKTIQAGNHYPDWDINLPWIGSQTITRYITFHENCEYDSAPYNADDVNKLFGLSFGVRGVHWNSARFGWRWSKSEQCIELLAYVYNEGQRNWDEQLRFPVVAKLKLGQQARCFIDYEEVDGVTEYVFTAIPDGEYGNAVRVKAPSSLPHYGLTHGLYFGGELVAPHRIDVDIDRSA